MPLLANHLFHHFGGPSVLSFAGGPGLILVPGPRLALNGPDWTISGPAKSLANS